MATFSLGNVTSPIAQQMRLAQLGEMQNPNLALEREIQRAVQLQQIQQQSPEGQLALQLRQAQLNSAIQNQAFQQQQQAFQLRDLQNPQAALARKLTEELTLKGALNPDLGIRAAESGLLGQTIGSPAAIGQTEAELNALTAANPQLAIPTAAPTAGETPISLFGIQTGLTSNPNIPRAALEAKTNENIKLANARATAQGQPIEYFMNLDGTTGWRPKKIFGATDPVADTLKTTTGDAAKEIPKPTKGSGGALTANQQSNLRLRGGRALVDINQYTNPETGVVDWNLYASEVGKAEGNTLHANNLIKNARNSVKTTLDEKNLQIYGNRMVQANTDFDKLTQVGFDPTSLGAEGLLGGWSPNLLKSNERQQYEQAERNFINSTLRRESGAVITDDEFANARKQYFPQPGDGEPVLAQKAANRKLVADEFIRLGGQQQPAAPAPAGKIKIIAPDGTEGYWPSDKPIPKGFKSSQ